MKPENRDKNARLPAANRYDGVRSSTETANGESQNRRCTDQEFAAKKKAFDTVLNDRLYRDAENAGQSGIPLDPMTSTLLTSQVCIFL